eukprot:5427364-Amphidinium_carterae.1
MRLALDWTSQEVNLTRRGLGRQYYFKTLFLQSLQIETLLCHTARTNCLKLLATTRYIGYGAQPTAHNRALPSPALNLPSEKGKGKVRPLWLGQWVEEL